jgi:hypothetical protein
MLCDADGRPVSASMKPLRSLRVLAGGSSSVSSSVSAEVPGAVMDMVTRGLWSMARLVSRVSQRVAQQRFWGELTWREGAAGSGVLACGCRRCSIEQQDVVPCADAEGCGVLDGWRGVSGMRFGAGWSQRAR